MTAPSCAATLPSPMPWPTPCAPCVPTSSSTPQHTAVDKAESEPARARLLNATTPGALAQEAARLGAWLVHYSTDYVFDGSGDRPWTEDDATGPLSVYGATKLEGEQLIQQAGCQHLILRTSWVYAARGDNFAKTMLRLAQEREHLTVINDQWGAPTGADLLADVTAHALRQLQARPGRRPVPLRRRRRDHLAFLCKIRHRPSHSSAKSYTNKSKRDQPRAYQCLSHPRLAPAQLAPEHIQTASHLRPDPAALAAWRGAHAGGGW